MNEYIVELHKQTYIGGVKTKITKESLIQARSASDAHRLAELNNKGWKANKEDVHKVIIKGDENE